MKCICHNSKTYKSKSQNILVYHHPRLSHLPSIIRHLFHLFLLSVSLLSHLNFATADCRNQEQRQYILLWFDFDHGADYEVKDDEDLRCCLDADQGEQMGLNARCFRCFGCLDLEDDADKLVKKTMKICGLV